MQLKAIAKIWLILLMCFILLACTLSVEETFIPDASQGEGDIENPGGGTDVDEPDNPNEGTVVEPPHDMVHDASYYLDFASEEFGDGSDGLKAGDRFDVIISDYVYPDNGMAVRGQFEAYVMQDMTLEVSQAILLVDSNHVVVDNGVIQDGILDIDTVNRIAASWVETLVNEQWISSYGDYYCFSRMLDTSIQIQDPYGEPADYNVRYLVVREKKEDADAYDCRTATRLRMDGNEPVWLEALSEFRFVAAQITSCKLGSYVTGDFNLVMAEGPNKVPSANFIYELMVSKYGDMIEGFNAGDSVKGIINGDSGSSFDGSFTIHFVDESSIYVDNAIGRMSQDDFVIIDDTVVEGDFPIEDVRATLMNLCTEVQSDGFDSNGNYFLFKRAISDPMYTTALYDDEWNLQWLQVDTYIAAWELPDTPGADSRFSVQFSLTNASGANIELEAVQSGIWVSDITWYKNGLYQEGQKGSVLVYGPDSKVSGSDFSESLFDMYGTGLDGFRTGDKVYAILRNKYNDGAQGHFSATVTSSISNSFTVRVDDAVLLFDDGQVVVEDSLIAGSSPMTDYALQQFIQRHLEYVMRNEMVVTNSDYIRLERNAGGESLYAFDTQWNAVQYTVDSFQLVVESEDLSNPRVAMKASLSGAEDVVIETTETDSFFTDTLYFQIGSQITGTPGIIMYYGPSMVIDGQYYLDLLGPDGTGIMLNYETGDTVHLELDNYWFEQTGSYLTGTIDAIVTASDILIENAEYTMDGCIVSIENDDVTFGGAGPLYDWNESTYLGYTKRLVTEAAVNLDNPNIVSFSQVRNLRQPGSTITMIDNNYISRDFTVEKCSLTRDKSGDENFECVLESSSGGWIILNAKNGVLTGYAQ